jgi:hypothetical protein|tara:strand:+ start:949 stop:2178 length:1230 start_codon:yes stop_codon:yes gene_type:complete
MIKAIFFFIKIQFFIQKNEVIFSSSIVFNRGKKNSNKLLNPFKKFLKEHNIQYIAFEEPDLSGSYKNFKVNNESISLMPVMLLEIILRRSLRIFSNNDTDKIEQIVRSISHKIFFRNLQANSVITLIDHRADLWRLAMPSAKIYDYQHGITYPGHPRYLTNGEPPNFKKACNIITLTHSRFISDLLISNDKSGFYNHTNTLCVGYNYNFEFNSKKHHSHLKILFSLQDASEGDQKNLNFYNNKVLKFLKENISFFKKNNITISLKRHPRADLRTSQNYENISPNIAMTSENDLHKLSHNHNLHITFNSTMAIDMASAGIPTIFLNLENPKNHLFPFLSPKEIFFSYLRYPLQDMRAVDAKSFQALITQYREELLSSDSVLSNKLLDWHNLIMEPFNSKCLKELFNLHSK